MFALMDSSIITLSLHILEGKGFLIKHIFYPFRLYFKVMSFDCINQYTSYLFMIEQLN